MMKRPVLKVSRRPRAGPLGAAGAWLSGCLQLAWALDPAARSEAAAALVAPGMLRGLSSAARELKAPGLGPTRGPLPKVPRALICMSHPTGKPAGQSRPGTAWRSEHQTYEPCDAVPSHEILLKASR